MFIVVTQNSRHWKFLDGWTEQRPAGLRENGWALKKRLDEALSGLYWFEAIFELNISEKTYIEFLKSLIQSIQVQQWIKEQSGGPGFYAATDWCQWEPGELITEAEQMWPGNWGAPRPARKN